MSSLTFHLWKDDLLVLLALYPYALDFPEENKKKYKLVLYKKLMLEQEHMMLISDKIKLK